jgi:hypothetical protein
MVYIDGSCIINTRRKSNSIIRTALFCIVLLFIHIMCSSAQGQPKGLCKIIVVAQVIEIEKDSGDISGGVYAAYRRVKYVVIDALKGRIDKRSISVAHMITGSTDKLKRLQAGDTVLLCLMELDKRETSNVALRSADFIGSILLDDCSCKDDK